jgi:Phosphopantetheinyl transferase
MNSLYFAEINSTFDSALLEQLLTFVCDEKQTKVKRFRVDIDKKLSLYSELLVRTLICKTFSIQNNEIVFDRNKYGKPCLRDYPDFNFNLSHTRKAIAVAVFDRPVGVDIEKIREADLEIAKRFFKENENAYITGTENDQNKRFYEIWTKKEAYVKCLGKGLSIPLNTFDVLGNNISMNIETFEKDDYIMSVCNACLKTQCSMTELSENEIANTIMALR